MHSNSNIEYALHLHHLYFGVECSMHLQTELVNSWGIKFLEVFHLPNISFSFGNLTLLRLPVSKEFSIERFQIVRYEVSQARKLHQKWFYTCQTNDQLVSETERKTTHTQTHWAIVFCRPVANTMQNKYKLTACLSGWIISVFMYVIIDFLFRTTHLSTWFSLFFSLHRSIGERDFSSNLFEETSGVFRKKTERKRKNYISEQHSTVFSHFHSDSINYQILPEMSDMRMIFIVFRSDQPFQTLKPTKQTKKMILIAAGEM